jgi:hypothetical protein
MQSNESGTLRCVIKNPVLRNEDGSVVVDEFGQSKLRHGDTQIRLEQLSRKLNTPGKGCQKQQLEKK